MPKFWVLSSNCGGKGDLKYTEVFAYSQCRKGVVVPPILYILSFKKSFSIYGKSTTLMSYAMNLWLENLEVESCGTQQQNWPGLPSINWKNLNIEHFFVTGDARIVTRRSFILSYNLWKI